MTAEQLRNRTYKFALEVVLFCRSLKKQPETYVIRNQILRSATSVSLNYSAACQARSKNEWFSKICIVAEESDETHLLLRFIQDLDLAGDHEKLAELKKEALELVKIFSKAKSSYKTDNRTNEPIVSYLRLAK
jgi:four helix bundle protein